MKISKSYVYFFADPRPKGTTYYVGRGQGGRAGVRKRGKLTNEVTEAIEAEGLKHKVTILEVPDVGTAKWLEEIYINFLGRRITGDGILTNVLGGGGGKLPGGRKTKIYEFSLQHRAALTEAAIKRAERLSKEERAEIYGKGNRGKSQTKERRLNISKALENKPKTLEHNQKVSVALEEVWKRPGYKSKMREAFKKGWEKRRARGKSLEEPSS